MLSENNQRYHTDRETSEEGVQFPDHVHFSARISTKSYPALAVDIPGNLPVEIFVYAHLAPGQAAREMAASHALQLDHPTFTDLFFEASAKIANTDFAQGEKTAIYSFLVGKEDLEFHRHEGHRVIVGTIGSGGAYMRFSYASPEQERGNPVEFLKRMFIVEMPPDCRFVLRFSGQVYHQFGPKDRNFDAVYAISIHTDEAGGLEGELLDEVLRNNASIPILTEPLSEGTQEVLKDEALVDRYATTFSLVPKHEGAGASFPEEWVV